MKRYKLYIADFDGTLINSFEGLKFFYREIFGVVGVSLTDEDCYNLTKMSLQEAYQRYAKNDDPVKIQAFKDKCMEVVESRVLLKLNVTFSDTIPFIIFLKEKHLPNAVVTGNDSHHVNMVFDNLGINDFYQVLICSNELTHQKPHPEGILKAIKALKYEGDYQDVCYIGDALNDVLAAKRAGVTPILLDRHNEYNKNDDAVIIHSLLELIN